MIVKYAGAPVRIVSIEEFASLVPNNEADNPGAERRVYGSERHPQAGPTICTRRWIEAFDPCGEKEWLEACEAGCQFRAQTDDFDAMLSCAWSVMPYTAYVSLAYSVSPTENIVVFGVRRKLLGHAAVSKTADVRFEAIMRRHAHVKYNRERDCWTFTSEEGVSEDHTFIVPDRLT